MVDINTLKKNFTLLTLGTLFLFLDFGVIFPIAGSIMMFLCIPKLKDVNDKFARLLPLTIVTLVFSLLYHGINSDIAIQLFGALSGVEVHIIDAITIFSALFETLFLLAEHFTIILTLDACIEFALDRKLEGLAIEGGKRKEKLFIFGFINALFSFLSPLASTYFLYVLTNGTGDVAISEEEFEITVSYSPILFLLCLLVVVAYVVIWIIWVVKMAKAIGYISNYQKPINLREPEDFYNVNFDGDKFNQEHQNNDSTDNWEDNFK